MALIDDLTQTGAALFRRRGHLPLLFLPLFALALSDFAYFGGSETGDHLWEAFCLGVAALGLFVRAVTVGCVPWHTSGRNTREQKAAVLNTTGMYSIVRHPLYLGNFLIWLGLALFVHQLWLLLVAVLAFWLYYERIMLAEEQFLRARFGAEFEAWAARTPAFVPAAALWRAPALPFSARQVLAREYPTWLATVAAFFLLELGGYLAVGEPLHVDRGWGVLVGAAAVLYVVLRRLKKRGRLAVADR